MSRSVPLPHQREAEASVLGAVLLRNDVMSELAAVLDDESFYVPRHCEIWRAFNRLHTRGEPIDIVTVEAELRRAETLGLVGGIAEVGVLADRYGTSHNVLHHAELLGRAKRLRRMSQTAAEISEQARGDVPDVDDFIDAAERRVLEISSEQRPDRFQPISGLIKDAFVAITERAKAKNAVTGVPTGFADLDAMTGGLQKGDLVIVAGRPSMGKTAFAINMVQNSAVIQSRHRLMAPEDRPPLCPALVISIEMSAQSLVERMICSESRVSSARLRAGRVLENEFRDMVGAADRLHKSPVFITDPASPTITQIRAEARRFRASKEIFPTEDTKGVIIVDYLQLARGSKGTYDMREQEVSEISRGLKAIAKETRLPVIALSQLNRGVDGRSDKRPLMSDLRESGAIEQDADVIMFVYREEQYATTDEEREKSRGKAEIIIGKQRNGPTGTVNLAFRGDYTRFENLSDR